MRSEAGNYAEAEQAHRETLRLIEKSFGPEHPATFTTRSLLAFTLDMQAKHAEAEGQIRQAIRLEPKNNAESVTDLVFLANNLWYQDRLAEAEKEARRAVAAAEKEAGDQPYNRENNRAGVNAVYGPLFCRMLVANTLRDQLRYAEAETEYRHVIEQEEKVIGPDDRGTLESYYNFAYQLAQEGRLSEAKEFARRAVAGVPTNYPGDHPYARRYRGLLSKIEAGEPITMSDAKFRDALASNNPLIRMR